MSNRLNLQPGSECLIRSLGPDKEVAQRLAEMGVLPGSILRVIRRAPFGGTFEVSMGRGQHIALRYEEIDALDCEMVAIPLSANTVRTDQEYRIRSLSGGETFVQKMAQQGIVSGVTIQMQDRTGRPFLIKLLPEGKNAVLGQGEADKIIIELKDGPER